MGGFDPKRWMNLLGGKKGLTAVVPKSVIKGYGREKLECLTGFLKEDKGGSRWIAVTKKHFILIRVLGFKLVAGKGESEHEAQFGDQVKHLADYGGFEGPTTQEVIDFFNFKVDEEQIVEFSY
jgi:hypothetical protein